MTKIDGRKSNLRFVPKLGMVVKARYPNADTPWNDYRIITDITDESIFTTICSEQGGKLGNLRPGTRLHRVFRRENFHWSWQPVLNVKQPAIVPTDPQPVLIDDAAMAILTGIFKPALDKLLEEAILLRSEMSMLRYTLLQSTAAPETKLHEPTKGETS